MINTHNITNIDESICSLYVELTKTEANFLE